MNNRLLARLLALATAAALVGCGPSGGDDDDDASCEGLLPGDLVISEIQSNPPGSDEGREWFEIYNATSAPVDLAGVTLVHSKNDLTGEKVHAIAAGQIEAGGYFVVGGVLEDFKPPYVDYGYGNDLGTSTSTLRNTDGRIALRCDVTELDATSYDTVGEGVSRSLNGASPPDYLANDGDENWCASTSTYGVPGEFGTPGEANDLCAVAGQCNEGGTPRDTVAPVAGDLVITEFMPNPDAVGDTDGEWFEVFVANPVDLNDLQIGKTLDDLDTVQSADCLSFGAGAHVLFARNVDTATNGGLPEVDIPIALGLSNSDSSLVLAYEGQLLDEVTWTSSSTGASTSLDPDFTDPTDNDDAANFCDGATPYGDGDLGTPGAPNDECLFAGDCIDGETVRAIDRPVAGDVVISEFMANPAAVSDTAGEWFEVYAVNGFDLNELELGSDFASGPEETIDSATCLPVAAGTYLLFARDGNTATNGGLPAVDAVVGISLSNAGDGLFVGSEGTLLDEIAWTGTAVAAGEARALIESPPATPGANDDADDDLTWCFSTTAYGAGDLGTPGGANDCP